MFKFGTFFCLAAVLAGEGLVLCDPSDSVFTIYKNDKPACLATAIADPTPSFPPIPQAKVFVTAARCVRGIRPSDLTIRNTKNTVNVSRVILHPFYKPPNVNYDIAVLKTTETVYGGLKPSENSTAPNATLQVVNHEPLKPANASLIGLTNCQTRLGNSVKLSSKMLCASVPRTLMDGSPLIGKNELKIYGVAFFSSQGIGVFTNMGNSEISSFIKDIL